MRARRTLTVACSVYVPACDARIENDGQRVSDTRHRQGRRGWQQARAAHEHTCVEAVVSSDDGSDVIEMTVAMREAGTLMDAKDEDMNRSDPETRAVAHGRASGVSPYPMSE